MRRLAIFTFLIIALAFSLYSDEHVAASLSPTDIQAAVNLCSAGDTVVLPAGDYNNFNDTVEIPNNISMRGAGVGVTIMRRTDTHEDPMFRWNNTYTASTHTVEISDFTLYGNDEVTMWGINIRRSVVDFKIHNLNIYGCGYAAIGIEGSLSQGVIYDCNFIDCNLDGHGYGIRVDAEDIGGEANYGDNSWAAGLDWNDDYWVFIEDCYFSNCRHAISSCWGSRYVARYCEFDNGRRAGYVDVHGRAPYDAAMRGGRATQVYENRFYGNTEGQPDGVDIHGGDVLCWNNAFLDWAIGACIYIQEADCPSGAYPHTDQMRAGYYWGNTRNGSPLTYDGNFFDNLCPGLLGENRDYFLFAPSGYTPYVYPHPLRGEATQGKTREVVITLTITGDPDFDMASSPTGASIRRDESARLTISVVPVDGYSGRILLEAAGLPGGVSAAFSQNPITQDEQSVLTISADRTAVIGSHRIIVRGVEQ